MQSALANQGLQFQQNPQMDEAMGQTRQSRQIYDVKFEDHLTVTCPQAF